MSPAILASVHCLPRYPSALGALGTASNDTAVCRNGSNQLAACNSSFLTTEADTLATVTGRGATTSTASSFTGGATIRSLTVDTATGTQDRILVTAAASWCARFDGTITNADLTAARTYTLPNASGTLAVSASGNIALSAAGDISFTGQLPIANGGTNATTSQAAINNLSQLTTNGDLLYNNGTNSYPTSSGS